MHTSQPSPSPRADAVADLEAFADRVAGLDAERRALIAAAWNANERNITTLARAAGVHRDVVYGDLRALGIDYINKSDDPYLTRMVQAYVQLAQQFDARSALSQPTRDAFGAVLAVAGSYMVSLQPRELAKAIQQVLEAPVADTDREGLGPLLEELRTAWTQFAVRLAPVRTSPRPGAMSSTVVRPADYPA